MAIELKSRDLYITDVEDKKNGGKQEVVRLKASVAFDEAFIEECKMEGVKKFIYQDEEVDEDEDNS